MAAELRITPEWLSKILHGHERPSYNIGLRFEDFLRRHQLEAKRSSRTSPPLVLHRRRNASAEQLRAEIRLSLSRLLTAAHDDPRRLAWIARQLRTKVSIPRSWVARDRGASAHPAVG